MRQRNYIGFARIGNEFGPAQGNGEYCAALPAGHYRVQYDDNYDVLSLHMFSPRLDEILNLGCKEFNEVINTVTRFLSPEATAEYKKGGFLYKRSFLFYGPPGTGKSVLSSRVADIAVQNKNAIALYPASYQALERLLEVLDDTDKQRFKVISLEEFDGLVNNHDEDSWTTLLDGQFQSDNRLLLATTNYIQAVPKRLLRPGRFSSLVKIPALTPSSRQKFLEAKQVDTKLIKKIVETTDEFTIDDLKEVVQSVNTLCEKPENVITGIRLAKKLGKEHDGDED
jgi:chaperone BCS1